MEFPPRPAQTGYAGGQYAHLSQITPEGVFPMTIEWNGNIESISFPGPEEGWALLDWNLIIHYTGGEWVSDQSYASVAKTSLTFLDSTHGWAVGSGFFYTTNGLDWLLTSINTQLTGDLLSVWFTDLNNGWAAGTVGQIAHSTNGGIDWTILEHDLTDALLRKVYFTSTNNGYIIGNEKTLLKYTTNTGMEEQGGTEAWGHGDFEVWPNPILSVVSLRSLVVGREPAVVEVLDLNGRILKTWNLEPGTWNSISAKSRRGYIL